MDIIDKIKRLKDERGWTDYRLSTEADIEHPTLRATLQRRHQPSLNTLTGLCHAFGITLSQLFCEDGEAEYLNGDEKALLGNYRRLCVESKQGLISLLKNIR